MIKSMLQHLSIGVIVFISAFSVYPQTAILSITLFIAYFVYKYWVQYKWFQYKNLHHITSDTFVEVESIPGYLRFTAAIHNVNIDRRKHHLDTI